MKPIIPDIAIIPIRPGRGITAIVTIMPTIAPLSNGTIEPISTVDALTTIAMNAKIIGMADMVLQEALRVDMATDEDMIIAVDTVMKTMVIAATTDIKIKTTAQDKPCAVLL